MNHQIPERLKSKYLIKINSKEFNEFDVILDFNNINMPILLF